MKLTFTHIFLGLVVGIAFTLVVVDQVTRLIPDTSNLCIHGQRIAFEHQGHLSATPRMAEAHGT